MSISSLEINPAHNFACSLLDRGSNSLPAARNAGSDNQSHSKDENGRGDESEVTEAQVLKDQLRGSQTQCGIADPSQFHPTPTPAALDKCKSYHADCQSANECNVMDAEIHSQ